MSSSSRCAGPDASRRRLLRLLPLVALAGWFTSGALASTAPPEVALELPGARLQGQGRLRFLGLHLYDAFLWSVHTVAATDAERAAVALELRYARALRGPLIAERSLVEMKRVGEVDDAAAERWLDAMKRLFPDVAAGDRITGVHRPGEGARFHVNGRFVGEVADATFARLFFGIWLSARTSQPQLRAALLGAAT